jgi:diguanylate cyclase (GGDEF)-like protein
VFVVLGADDKDESVQHGTVPARKVFMIRLSLKTKMSIAVSLLVIVLMSWSAFLIISRFETRFKETFTVQHYALINEMARETDDALKDARQTIIAAAATFPRAAAKSPPLAQRVLDKRRGLKSLFDNGIFLFSPTGKLIAESPNLRRRGSDFSGQDYVRKTVESARPFISKPYVSAQSHHHPAVMFTAPVFGGDGNVVAVLAGGVDLTRDNFLGQHAHTTFGTNGYIYIFDTDRTIIMHPDRSTILKQDESTGSNMAFDKVIAGFEGTEETVNTRGEHALTSFRPLKTTNWILAANYPISEAYAPIREASRYSVVATVVGVALSVLIVWLTMKVLTAPLARLTRHIGSMSGNNGAAKELHLDTGDEIGELAAAFNTMVRNLDQRLDELRNMSTHDLLTGLYNRAYFNAEVERLARGRQFPISLIMAEVNGLKDVNDNQGHEAGDALLRATTRILLAAFRAEDVVTRAGDDEFAVLLPDTNRRAAIESVKRIRKCQKEANKADAGCAVSLSIGVATAERGDDIPRALKLCADRMRRRKFTRKEATAPDQPVAAPINLHSCSTA